MPIGTPLDHDLLWEDKLRLELAPVLDSYTHRAINAALIKEIAGVLSQKLADLFKSGIAPVQLTCTVEQDPRDPTSLQIRLKQVVSPVLPGLQTMPSVGTSPKGSPS